jgi:hypothetical protein
MAIKSFHPTRWEGLDAEKSQLVLKASNKGNRYYATDTQILYEWNGSAWALPSGGGMVVHGNEYHDPAFITANTPITGATKTKITYDAKGLVTGGANATPADIGAEPANANIQAHVTSAHAPANAQKNSDITKEEIEAKLIGVISSHSHAVSGGLGYAINVQALTSSPADAQTVYFGMLPKAPVTTANISKVYVRKAGTIKIAEIYCYSGTAGTAEAWSLYIRKNNTTDYLIATLSVSANERVFSNAALNIAMAAGDYFEIKGVQPTWATNPATTIYGGYIYIE